MFIVELSQTFNGRQGLSSPVRSADKQPPLVGSDGFKVILRAGISFSDDQLTDNGWFVDTDAVEKHLNQHADYLSSQSWTQLFDFRPTFELVSKRTYDQLKDKVPQLRYIELENVTIGVKTRYEKD